MLEANLARNHLLVQDANDQHFVRLRKIEDDMLAMLKPA